MVPRWRCYLCDEWGGDRAGDEGSRTRNGSQSEELIIANAKKAELRVQAGRQNYIPLWSFEKAQPQRIASPRDEVRTDADAIS